MKVIKTAIEKDNVIYKIGDWQVFKMKIQGKTRYYVGRISEGGYLWVNPTAESAIDVCNAAHEREIFN